MELLERLLAVAVACTLAFPFPAGGAQLASGHTAPSFVLQDLSGRSFELKAMKEKPLTVLYFFDVLSFKSHAGLQNLNELAKEFPRDLDGVWAITASPREKVADFAGKKRLKLPILLDSKEVSGVYQAKQVLPVTWIIGPKLKILDYCLADSCPGKGKTMDSTLEERLLELEVQRKKTGTAKAMSRYVQKKRPQSVKAPQARGYALLKEGRLKEAEEVFRDLAKRGGQGEILGKEGLADVYTRRNEHGKALQLIREVKQKAPERSYVHVLEGKILDAKNRKKEAEEAYRTATAKKGAEPYQEALPYNQLGRVYQARGEQGKARELFEQAESADPYYVEGTTNRGITLEKEGKWDQALQAYRQALAVDKTDVYAAALERRANEMAELARDAERGRRMDQLVKELAERYRRQQQAGAAKEDDAWTSHPMKIAFVDFEEKGGLPERAGFSPVFLTLLTERFRGYQRVEILERARVERVLEELQLGSSDLANPDTALKLGKLFAARLIGTGSLLYLPQETVLTFRLIDTETSQIPRVFLKRLGPQLSLEDAASALNREIVETVAAKYPLRGYVVRISGGEGIVNLGTKHGVAKGARFDVLEEEEPIRSHGKVLHFQPKVVGQVEVVRTEPELSYVKPLGQQRALKVDDKIQGAKR